MYCTNVFNVVPVLMTSHTLTSLQRYDLLCLEGISRGIQVFLGK